jgi:lipopolysaccharide/colanic/teichoic acid biosynthesis glycosyltransferase
MTQYRIAKRIFDIAMSLAGIICLCPVMIWVAVRVRREMGKNVIFRQERAGEGGKTFTLLKFRSMTDERDERGEPLPDEKRLPPFGKWLRATSLDELPQLWNVLTGDMSLVGPRPLLPEYVPLYGPSQKKRLDAPPGITGWAQINGRNAISWPEKFALDVWYVEHATFALDLKILLMTIKKTLARDGISARDEVTMPRFTGER